MHQSKVVFLIYTNKSVILCRIVSRIVYWFRAFYDSPKWIPPVEKKKTLRFQFPNHLHNSITYCMHDAHSTPEEATKLQGLLWQGNDLLLSLGTSTSSNSAFNEKTSRNRFIYMWEVSREASEAMFGFHPQILFTKRQKVGQLSCLAQPGSVAPTRSWVRIPARTNFHSWVKKSPRCARCKAWPSQAWAMVRGFFRDQMKP